MSQCINCGKLQAEGSSYCPECKPKPSDKYAETGSDRFERWASENPDKAEIIKEKRKNA